jgi:hypothetical protein
MLVNGGFGARNLTRAMAFTKELAAKLRLAMEMATQRLKPTTGNGIQCYKTKYPLFDHFETPGGLRP